MIAASISKPAMTNARDALTPEALAMLHTIARTGSFAAAARALHLVPSALTYRVRQLEDTLDVLLFDRRSRQARPTAAGLELLVEGQRVLDELEAVAQRVRRVATGWESELTIAVDSLIDPATVMELCAAFLEQAPPTRLRLRDEVLSGTLQALTSGQADLALGVGVEVNVLAQGVQFAALGQLPFVFAVAPHHPLAQAPQPLSDELIRQHRAVAVADSTPQGRGLTIGLLAGQDVFTVPSMPAKLQAQLRGLGAGFLPEPLARPYLDAGRLVALSVERPPRITSVGYAWRRAGMHAATAVPEPAGHDAHPRTGRALQWWLKQLRSPATRAALLCHPGRITHLGVESGS
jgi:DNA-binding transcriptional LysR family regulator